MNKVQLIGRLTKEPEMRYSQNDNQTAVTRYTLAVDRRNKREGEPTADFINCITFDKSAEFINKYIKKGQRIAVAGRLQTRTWTDKQNVKRFITEVVTDEHYFADSSSADKAKPAVKAQPKANESFYQVDGSDDDLPF